MLNAEVMNDLDTDEGDVNEIIDYLYSVIEDQSNELKHQPDLMAVMRDVVGQIVTCLNSTTPNKIGVANRSQVVKSINKNFATLPKEVKRFIKKSAEFHFSAMKLNPGHPDHFPAWKDDHPLRYPEKMNFFNVVNATINKVLILNCSSTQSCTFTLSKLLKRIVPTIPLVGTIRSRQRNSTSSNQSACGKPYAMGNYYYG
jgi:hypothetical protein